jgi:hypothetical protein
MLPPLLQSDWHNRPYFHARTCPHEIFYVQVRDPTGGRVLCLEFSLADAAVQARWDPHFLGRESGLAVVMDPERGGVGLGTCALEDEHTHGVVRSDGRALAWDLALRPCTAPYEMLPAWLYESSGVSHKRVTPVPLAEAHGEIELWHGLAAGSRCERVRVDGWTATQGHHWGRHGPRSGAWCQVATRAPESIFFECFHGPMSIFWMRRQVAMWRHTVDGESPTGRHHRRPQPGVGPHWDLAFTGGVGFVEGPGERAHLELALDGVEVCSDSATFRLFS